MHLTNHQKRLTAFASKSKIRPELAGVMTDGRTAVATDSFKLVEIVNDIEETVVAPIIIDARQLNKIKGGTQEEYPIVEDIENHTAIVNTEGSAHTVQLYDAAGYPKYQAIIDEAATRKSNTIKVNAAYLRDICDVLARIGTDESITLHVPHLALQPLYITATGNGHTARALLMPLNK